MLGQIFRSRSQIKTLAETLLGHQGIEDPDKQRIVDFLCSKSGSHDRTINRREARDFGLNIVSPSQELYECINQLYESIARDMEIRTRFDPMLIAQSRPEPVIPFECQRVLIESTVGPSITKKTKGNIRKVTSQQNPAPGMPQMLVQAAETTVHFDGWEED